MQVKDELEKRIKSNLFLPISQKFFIFLQLKFFVVKLIFETLDFFVEENIFEFFSFAFFFDFFVLRTFFQQCSAEIVRNDLLFSRQRQKTQQTVFGKRHSIRLSLEDPFFHHSICFGSGRSSNFELLFLEASKVVLSLEILLQHVDRSVSKQLSERERSDVLLRQCSYRQDL